MDAPGIYSANWTFVKLDGKIESPFTVFDVVTTKQNIEALRENKNKISGILKLRTQKDFAKYKIDRNTKMPYVKHVEFIKFIGESFVGTTPENNELELE